MCKLSSALAWRRGGWQCDTQCEKLRPARQHSLCQSLWDGEVGPHEGAVAEHAVVMAVASVHCLGAAWASTAHVSNLAHVLSLRDRCLEARRGRRQGGPYCTFWCMCSCVRLLFYYAVFVRGLCIDVRV